MGRTSHLHPPKSFPPLFHIPPLLHKRINTQNTPNTLRMISFARFPALDDLQKKHIHTTATTSCSLFPKHHHYPHTTTLITPPESHPNMCTIKHTRAYTHILTHTHAYTRIHPPKGILSHKTTMTYPTANGHTKIERQDKQQLTR